MTWEIVVGLIALLGAAVSICTIVSNNTKAMTELKCSVDELKRAYSRNDKTVQELVEQGFDHEIRITKLEEKK